MHVLLQNQEVEVRKNRNNDKTIYSQGATTCVRNTVTKNFLNLKEKKQLR